MEQEKNKEKSKVGLNTQSAKEILVQKTSEMLDFSWVLDRFSY